VVFVRKHLPETPILKASISDEHCRNMAAWSNLARGADRSGQFPGSQRHSIPAERMPSCSHLGLCLNKPELVDINLTRKLGAADLDWLNELVD